MQNLPSTFWPTARDYAESVQCPAVCFEQYSLKAMLPAVDRLGMPLVTSGQFAYVFKLNPVAASEASLAVRCFRGYLGDRMERYGALDAHLNAQQIPALPRFKYLPKGILVMGRRYPVLIMEWVEGPTLDVYLDEAVGRREALMHMADEWLKLVAALEEAEVAHGDLQHGNIIVERGQLRLVDLDGMYVPALEGFRASEVGHQHYQHPARDITHFSRDTDNFSALVVYLSLISLAEQPELWREHHDENLIFTRADFIDPEASELFKKIEAIGEEHARLASALKLAAQSEPTVTPRLTELVGRGSGLPAWINAPDDIDVSGRTREVSRASVFQTEHATPWPPKQPWRSSSSTPQSANMQSLFNMMSSAPASPPPARVVARDPSDIRGNTFHYAKNLFGSSYGYIWWIPLHNVLLGEVWGALGAGPVAGMFISFLVVFTLFVCYGFFRSIYEAETSGGKAVPAFNAGPLPPAQGGATLGGQGAQAFFAAQGATNTAPVFPSQQQTATPTPAVAPCPVVGKRSLNIYHLPDCAWADKIPRKDRVEFDSLAVAQSAGFRPCHVCKP